MLTLERRIGESLKIYPTEEVPVDMTVAELFSQGPLEIMRKDAHKGKAKIGIKVPLELNILRDEIVKG